MISYKQIKEDDHNNINMFPIQKQHIYMYAQCELEFTLGDNVLVLLIKTINMPQVTEIHYHNIQQSIHKIQAK